MLPAAGRLLPCFAAAPQLLSAAGLCSQGGLVAAPTAPHSQPSHKAWAGPSGWQQRVLHTQQHGSSSQGQQKQQAPTSSLKQDPESVWTAPNLLSVGRALSAPWIAWLILQENWPWAVTATVISGLTDWADGALARRMGQSSVLGSYLDPAADKALVCCVVGALAVQGAAPTWVAGLVVGRDVALVAGMFLHRWRTLGWRTSGITASQFFSTSGSGGNTQAGVTGQSLPFMRPLLISKVNTVLQITLVCGCMTHAWLQLPDSDLLHNLELLTAATTVMSLGAYMFAYSSGKLLPIKQ